MNSNLYLHSSSKYCCGYVMNYYLYLHSSVNTVSKPWKYFVAGNVPRIQILEHLVKFLFFKQVQSVEKVKKYNSLNQHCLVPVVSAYVNCVAWEVYGRVNYMLHSNELPCMYVFTISNKVNTSYLLSSFITWWKMVSQFSIRNVKKYLFIFEK